MTTENFTDPRQCSIAPEAQGWFQPSDRARDTGDRAFCAVLVVAVAVAIALGTAWLWAMPASFR